MWPDTVKYEAAQLRAFRDIDQTFRWDGIIYRVKAHTEYLPMVGEVAHLVCEYRYKDGTTLTRSFGINNLPTLKEANP